jgi:hypothetical protein
LTCRLLIRFWRYTQKSEAGCWLWTGSVVTGTGYGVLVSGKAGSVMTHRLSYEIHVGPIPEGYVVDHLCRVRNCVRPDHLEAVTPGENTLRGVSVSAENKRKDACKRGHVFDAANTCIVVRHGVPVGRSCRACRTLHDRRRRAAQKAVRIPLDRHKPFCLRGHPFDEANTTYDKNSKRRKCRQCSNLRARKYQARKRLDAQIFPVPAEQLAFAW